MSKRFRRKGIESITVNAGELGEIGEVLEDLMQEIAKEVVQSEQVKETVGIISEDLRLKYLSWREQHDELKQEIKYKTEQLERKLKRELTELFEDRYLESEFNKEKLWKEIRKELGILDEDIKLNIEPSSGKIAKWVDNPTSRQSKGPMH